MACVGLTLRDVVVVEEQAVALKTSIPLAVGIACGRGERAFRIAVNRERQVRERLANVGYQQSIVALLGYRKSLVGA